MAFQSVSLSKDKEKMILCISKNSITLVLFCLKDFITNYFREIEGDKKQVLTKVLVARLYFDFLVENQVTLKNFIYRNITIQ